MSEDVIDLVDEGVVPWTGECRNWRCQTWDPPPSGTGCHPNARPVRPKLVKNEHGFWCCPKCGGSYGRHEKDTPDA